MADKGRAGLDLARTVIHTCVAGRVRQISRVVTARYDEELRELGITANQLTILSVVAVLGQATPTEMSPYLLMDESTLSRNVRRMIEHHWLAMIPAEDRRSHYLVVAPKGFEVLDGARPAWQRAHAWALDLLGADGAAEVRRLAALVNPNIPA